MNLGMNAHCPRRNKTFRTEHLILAKTLIPWHFGSERMNAWVLSRNSSNTV